VLERIEGRLQEFLICRDHRLISICTMGAAHFEALAGADVIQYEQHVPGHFVLKVVSRKPLEETSLRKIEQAVYEKTQNGCTVKVQQVEHITMTRSGKHMMLQQHLDLSGHLGKRESE
jgi:phenylacetate-CoA ligase